MLVLLLGPSGVGKTSIIQVLEETYGWTVIPSYITRPARKGEQHKRTLSMNEYQQLRDEGRLFTHVEQLGHMYGTLKSDVDSAQRGVDVRILDFDVYAYRRSFAGIDHLSVIVLPEGREQLRAQLMEAGRLDRLEGALDLLSVIQNPKELQTLGLSGATRVINRPNQVEDTAATVAATVRSALSGRSS